MWRLFLLGEEGFKGSRLMNWDDRNTDDTDEGKTILSLRSRIHG